MKKYISIAFIAIGFLACHPASDYKQITSDPSFYANTVHELNQVVMGNNFSPIVASRNYAYASIAGYEVTAAGAPAQYQSLAGQVKKIRTAPSASMPHGFSACFFHGGRSSYISRRKYERVYR